MSREHSRLHIQNSQLQVDTSVIIVTYNGRKWLGPCLTALAAQEGVDFEVILVDNASTDDSVELVRREFPEVIMVQLERNVGFAAGSNAGARVARGRFLAFLNNDTVPAPDWLKALRRGLDEHLWAAMAASQIVLMDDPAVLDSAGDGLTRWGGAFKHGHGELATVAREPREVFGVCGAACLIRREVFDTLGGFDEDFFMVYEDVDFSYRAQLLGHRCVHVPRALVRHALSGSLGRISSPAVYYGQRNLEWAYWKNTPGPLLAQSLAGHFLYDLVAAAYFLTTGKAGAFSRAKIAALRGLPALWRKRREIQRQRKTDLNRLWHLMDRRWIALKVREKRFDLKAVR